MKSQMLYFWVTNEQENIFMTEKKTKQVKLMPSLRKLTYSEKIVPVLHISGVWLEENGFRAGSHVMITIEENQLIIKPVL